MQHAGVCTRGMAKKTAINAAAASLRAAKVPTRQRTYTTASVAAACAAIIASNSPQRQKQTVARVNTTPSPKATGATPKKAEAAESRMASVMTVGAQTMEEQMHEMMRKLEQVMKDNEEKNKKIEELQKEVVALGKKKVGEVNPAIEAVKDAENAEDADDDTRKIIPTNVVDNDQLQLMIANVIRSQIGGDSSSSSRYAKSYTRRINGLLMPQGYQPPRFQLFDGQGNPRQHIAHFVETCNNAGTDGDLLVKQFVRSLKGVAFDWYTDLEPESIDSWDQMEEEFLNRFYSTRRIVSMSELTSARQWEDEPVVEYISRWRALSLQCKDRISEASAVEMCINGMNWELLYILKGIKPRNFQELATRAHDMEITVKGHRASLSRAPVERKEFNKTDKAPRSAPKEVMNVSSKGAPVKISAKPKQDKKSDVVRKDFRSDKPTLEELQAKKYPFPDSDLSGMLDSLLENNIIQLPEPKRPADVNKVNHPKYCRYHRLVSHSIEECITLKELIMRLIHDGTIEVANDETVESNQTTVVACSDADEDESDLPPGASSVFDRIHPPAKQEDLLSRKRSSAFDRLGAQDAYKGTTPRNRGHQSRKHRKLSKNSVFNRLGASLKMIERKKSLKGPITTFHQTRGKFKSKRNCPYAVQEGYTNGAYKIADEDGWRSGSNNGNSLQCYYI